MKGLAALGCTVFLSLFALSLSAYAENNLNEIENIKVVDGRFIVVEGPIPDFDNEQPKDLSSDQKHQLYLDGRITDDKGRIWNVKVVPGVNSIKAMFIDGWKSSGNHLKNLVHASFYNTQVLPLLKDAKHGMSEGFDFAKESAKWGFFTVPKEWLIFGIRDDYTSMFRENDQIEKERFIGWQAAIILNHLKTGSLAMLRILTTPGGMALGGLGTLVGFGISGGSALYGVLASFGVIAWQPTAAFLEIMSRGSLVPGTLMIWNGIAWSFAQDSTVPTKENPPWVVLEGTVPPKTINISKEDLLFWAIRRSDDLLIADVLTRQPNLNATDKGGQTPLMAAIWVGRDQLALDLINRGVDVDKQDNEGWTATMAAIKSSGLHAKSRRAVLKALVSKKANLTLRSIENQTAADLAIDEDADIQALVQSR